MSRERYQIVCARETHNGRYIAPCVAIAAGLPAPFPLAPMRMFLPPQALQWCDVHNRPIVSTPPISLSIAELRR